MPHYPPSPPHFRIFLRDLRLSCKIGIDPAEQFAPQTLLLDIDIAPGAVQLPQFCEVLLHDFLAKAPDGASAANIAEHFAGGEFAEWAAEPRLSSALDALSGGGFVAEKDGKYRATAAAANYRAAGRPAADYAAVRRRMREFAASKTHGLMEEFAAEAAEMILEEFAAAETRVSCRKPRPFADLGEAGAEIILRRGW